MDRRLLAPRWLMVHAALVVAVLACGLLGSWQLDRAREQRDQSVRPVGNAELAPVDLDTLLPPTAPLRLDDVGRRVEVLGTYDLAAQLVVPDRDLDGATGALVIVPLVTKDGSAVVVVRGWRPTTAEDVPSPPAGQVVVSGWLGASEPAPGPALLPDGEVGSIHIPSLVNVVPHALRDGFVAMAAEDPPGDVGERATGLTALPAPERIEGGRLPLQNVFYAIEWWVFGLAAIVLWVSAIRRRDPVTPLRVPPATYTSRS